MHFVWFPCEMDFSPLVSESQPHRKQDSGTHGEKNPSHMENHTKCISSHIQNGIRGIIILAFSPCWEQLWDKSLNKILQNQRNCNLGLPGYNNIHRWVKVHQNHPLDHSLAVTNTVYARIQVHAQIIHVFQISYCTTSEMNILTLFIHIYNTTNKSVINFDKTAQEGLINIYCILKWPAPL